MLIQCPDCRSEVTVRENPDPAETSCSVCRRPLADVLAMAVTVAEVPTGDEDRDDGPTSTTDALPELPGDYVVVREIARGGMGIVYEAVQSKLGRRVALKVIRSGEFATADEVQRFRQEAEAAGRLDHPGIVPVHDVGEFGGHHYFSMGYVAGCSLQDELLSGPLDPRRAAELVAEIAEAVQYAHEKGIVHRDLKPANVLLDEAGRPRITDFGLARRSDTDSHLTRTGDVMGTPGYMPPEQASGRLDEIGPACDVYSLGGVLYALLTGRPPFRAANVVETLRLVLEFDPVAPRQLDPTIPRDLETICLKCLEKPAERRYRSAADLGDDVRRFLRDEPIRARPVTFAERSWRWCRRNPVVAGAVGAAAALALSIVVLLTVAYLREAELRAVADDATIEAEESLLAEQRARADADRERRATQLLLARSLVDHGRHLCMDGRAAHGLLWMARGLRTLPEKSPEEAALIRRRIGAWEPQLPRRRLVVRHGSVTDARFGPDGSWFATSGRGGWAHMWSATDGERIGVAMPHGAYVNGLDVDPAGKRILTAGRDGRVRIWSASDGSPIGEALVHPDRVNDAVFLGADTIVSCSARRVHFWNASRLQPSRDPIELSAEARRVVALPDGRSVAVATDRELVVFDGTGNEVGGRVQLSGFSEVCLIDRRPTRRPGDRRRRIRGARETGPPSNAFDGGGAARTPGDVRGERRWLQLRRP